MYDKTERRRQSGVGWYIARQEGRKEDGEQRVAHETAMSRITHELRAKRGLEM